MKVKSSRQAQEEHDQLIRLIILIAGSFFLLVVFFCSFFLPNDEPDQLSPGWGNALEKRRAAKKGTHRLAIILPFAGQTPDDVPAYMNLFCRGARAASDVADFLIIHNGVLANAHKLSFCHSNVKLIDLQSTEALAERLLRVLDEKDEDDWEIPRDRLLKVMTSYVKMYPYLLVEFKPAFGAIFQDLLTDYSHWGYSDMDMVYGDLGRHIEEKEWSQFDIVTFGFGDQARLYLKGQFTMHKNTERTRNLWNECDYLSHLDQRFYDIVQEREKFVLESAEGCYSAAILKNTEISVKYAVKAWTDVSETDTTYSHGLYMFQNSHHPHKHVLAKAQRGETHNERLMHLPKDWFYLDPVYKNRKQPLQVPVGEMEPIDLPNGRNKDIKCMYWVQDKYNPYLCLQHEVSSSETIFWVKGTLYKQKFVQKELHSKVESGPFFHFQEWKRRFRKNQLAVMDDPGATVAVLLPEGGIVVNQGGGTSKRHPPRPSPLGIPCAAWQIEDEDGVDVWPSHLPGQSYCLSGVADRHKFHMECKNHATWEEVKLFSKASGWGKFSALLDVTLVQVVGLTSSDSIKCKGALEVVAENLKRWKDQPSVTLIHTSRFVPEPLDLVSDFVNGMTCLENALIGLLTSEKSEESSHAGTVISQKALLNMAIDTVPTRFYLSGLDASNLIISPDTVQLARRKALAYQNTPGNLFLLPQFAFSDEEPWSISELSRARKSGHLKTPLDYHTCADSVNSSPGFIASANEIWWNETLSLVEPRPKATIPSSFVSLFDDIQLKLMGHLEEKRLYYDFLSSAHSPLMLVDNLLEIGHGDEGLRASVLAREVEEFGGGRCFDMLRLAQLIEFGYHLNILEGAFAASTTKSRTSIDSKHFTEHLCGTCSFLEGEEKLRDKIVRQEVVRPAIARSMWEALRTSK